MLKKTFPVTKLSFLSSTVVFLFVNDFTKHANVEFKIALSWAAVISPEINQQSFYYVSKPFFSLSHEKVISLWESLVGLKPLL